MTKNKSINDKQAELKMYRDLVIAAINYFLDNDLWKLKTADFDSEKYFSQLKMLAEEDFKKGRLTRLKQSFRDMAEPAIECRDLKFNQYLNEKTNYNIDIFKSYFERIDKMLAKGKITTDNQYYDLKILVDQLSEIPPADKEKMEKLEKMLLEYGQRKSKKPGKPPK